MISSSFFLDLALHMLDPISARYMHEETFHGLYGAVVKIAESNQAPANHGVAWTKSMPRLAGAWSDHIYGASYDPSDVVSRYSTTRISKLDGRDVMSSFSLPSIV